MDEQVMVLTLLPICFHPKNSSTFKMLKVPPRIQLIGLIFLFHRCNYMQKKNLSENRLGMKKSSFSRYGQLSEKTVHRRAVYLLVFQGRAVLFFSREPLGFSPYEIQYRIFFRFLERKLFNIQLANLEHYLEDYGCYVDF